MNNPSQVLSVFAHERVSKIVSQIIRKLQGFKEALSWEDSGLENTWDEICVQLQDEYSFEEEVTKMATHEQLAIWLETESAYSYDADEDDLESKYDPTEVCHHIKSRLFQKAGEWSNTRIRNYLER